MIIYWGTQVANSLVVDKNLIKISYTVKSKVLIFPMKVGAQKGELVVASEWNFKGYLDQFSVLKISFLLLFLIKNDNAHYKHTQAL